MYSGIQRQEQVRRNPRLGLRTKPDDTVLLWHGTLSTNLPSIIRYGLKPGRRTEAEIQKLWRELLISEGINETSFYSPYRHHKGAIEPPLLIFRERWASQPIFFSLHPGYAYANATGGIEIEVDLRRWIRDEIKRPKGKRRWSGPDWPIFVEVLNRRNAHIVLTGWELPISFFDREDSNKLQKFIRWWSSEEPKWEQETFSTNRRVSADYLRCIAHMKVPHAGPWRELDWESVIDYIEGDITCFD